jgi:hypothetical protein
MRFSTNFALPALVLFASSLAAHATTITETDDSSFTVAVPNGNATTTETTSFAQFNPLLGTLNSVELVIPGPLIFTLGTGPSPSYTFTFSVPTGSPVFNISASGTTATSLDLSSLFTGGGLGVFEGLGTLDGQVSLTANDGTLALLDTNDAGVAEEVIYDYTPNSVTPEPSSLALLGTGMLFGAGALYRRFRTQA